jgi:hypothetical protein
VKEVPDEALIENIQPVDVPALEKSLFATESTDCAKEIAKVTGDVVFVNELVAEEKFVGAVKVK